MALVNCENCGADVSDKARVCPKCGKNIKKDYIPISKCPECGREIKATETRCNNCGYKLKRGNKKLPVIGGIVVFILLVVGIVITMTNKGNNYVLDACKEIKKNLSNPNSLSLEDIYVSDDIGTNSTIDYVYRVYIVYKYTNNYVSRREDSVLYVVDDKGKTYFIEDSSSENLYAYKIIAEMEIFGLPGWFEPNDNWTRLNDEERDKVKKKIE